MEILDSGERQFFDTGSVRDTSTGKGRFDLLPWDAIQEVARIYEEGAHKYDERNWERGQPLMRYLDSAARHLGKLMAGHQDEPHAAQAAWNILGYLQTLAWIESGALPWTLDNRPPRMRVL